MNTTPTTSDVDYDQPAVLPDDEHAREDRLAWHAYMIRRIRADQTRLADEYDAERERLEQQIDALVAPLRAEIRQQADAREEQMRIIENAVAWHEAPLKSYALMRYREDDDIKTIPFVHGRSKLTTPKKAQVFYDPEQTETFMAWVRDAHPEIMKEPNITDLRKLVTVTEELKVIDTATGEVVPGVTASVPEQTWSFDPNPGDPF